MPELTLDSPVLVRLPSDLLGKLESHRRDASLRTIPSRSGVIRAALECYLGKDGIGERSRCAQIVQDAIEGPITTPGRMAEMILKRIRSGQ